MGRKNRIGIQLNITPLIDIVFLLLIFFILSYQTSKNTGIKIALPVAKNAETFDKDEITVFITGRNELFLNGKLVLLEDLLSGLEDTVKVSETKSVVIKADEKINLGLAVRVMDIAKQAEAKSLIISTKIENDK